MAEVYTNLPEKEKDSLLTTIDNLTKNQNTEPFSLNQNDYDAAIAFFVKRGFGRESAEKTAYIILRQAKIDSVNPQELLDQLTKASPVQLSELIKVNGLKFPMENLSVLLFHQNQWITKNC